MKYLVVECEVGELQTELNKSDYEAYKVVSVIYDGHKARVILEKLYY